MIIPLGSFSFKSVLINYNLAEIAALNHELKTWSDLGIRFRNIVKFFDRSEPSRPYRVSKQWLHNPRLITPYMAAINSLNTSTNEILTSFRRDQGDIHECLNFECVAEIAASELTTECVEQVVIRAVQKTQRNHHGGRPMNKRIYLQKRLMKEIRDKTETTQM